MKNRVLVQWVLLFAATLFSTAAAKPSSGDAFVMIVGTYHMANPGQDLHNVESDDVLAPERQQQLEGIADALAGFEPTLVAVEWPEDVTDERYRQYLDDALKPSRNEVVQLGFRLARKAGLERVHGIDVPGEFPFEAVQEWAAANDRADELETMSRRVGEHVQRYSQLQSEGTISDALRFMNTPEDIAWAQGFYMKLLRFGNLDEQPAADLLEAWAGRNYRICARLLQVMGPGERAVVFYGAGHAYYLRRCAIDTPGIELVEANDYLP